MAGLEMRNLNRRAVLKSPAKIFHRKACLGNREQQCGEGRGIVRLGFGHKVRTRNDRCNIDGRVLIAAEEGDVFSARLQGVRLLCLLLRVLRVQMNFINQDTKIPLIPTKVGIQTATFMWIPAFAGMSGVRACDFI
jgi:hypothetical protein